MKTMPDAPAPVSRVLFADDDEAFREAYAALLRRHGIDCICAPDAETAITLLGESEFDALLADIHMPGNSGLQLVERVPSIASGLPVILMTGFPSVETAALSVRLAVTAYMVKPPDLTELLAVLTTVVPQFRRIRAVANSRRQLTRWADDLSGLEDRIRRPSAAPQEALDDYLRITVSNLILQLMDVERSMAAWRQAGCATDLQRLDLINAIQHTVDVLERTRQHFRSKELGELRRRLQALLPETAGSANSMRSEKTAQV